jgi:hypothetical protein
VVVVSGEQDIVVIKAGTLRSRDEGEAQGAIPDLTDFESGAQRIDVKPHVVGFGAEGDEGIAGAFQMGQKRRWIDASGDAGGEVRKAGLRGMAGLPAAIRGERAAGGVNLVRTVAVDAIGAFAMSAHQTFKPPPGVEKIVVGGDQRRGKAVVSEEIWKVLGVRSVVIGDAYFETAIHESAQAGRQTLHVGGIVEPQDEVRGEQRAGSDRFDDEMDAAEPFSISGEGDHGSAGRDKGRAGAPIAQDQAAQLYLRDFRLVAQQEQPDLECLGGDAGG